MKLEKNCELFNYDDICQSAVSGASIASAILQLLEYCSWSTALNSEPVGKGLTCLPIAELVTLNVVMNCVFMI